MCLIFLAYRVHPEFPLILIANRDEYYERPSAPAAWWDDFPDIYGGRDLIAGGTWLGVARSGRFAAVTNYREPAAASGKRSRGDVVADFLRGDMSCRAYVEFIRDIQQEFSGFNLIAGEIRPGRSEVVNLSNRSGDAKTLAPGIYGLSNHLLDTPWPKVVRGRQIFSDLVRGQTISNEQLFGLLSDRKIANDADLPETGLSLDRERSLSAIFVAENGYGTRCSTILKFDKQGTWSFEERITV